MTKLVLLSYYYPPSEAVGGLRAEKVALAFRTRGEEVHVITARLPGEKGSLRRQEPGLTVETVEPWTNPRWWYVNLKRRFTPVPTPAEAAAASSGSDQTEEVSVPRLKRWISALLWLPDDKQGFIPPAVRAGLRARRAGATVLYTTVPPFSTHLAGLVLQVLTGMRWVLEFRDPWTDSKFRLAHQRSRWTSVIERWLERRCLARASLVVSVTEGIQHGLLTRVPDKARAKFLVVRNGIARLRRVSDASITSKPYRIRYVGSFYHRRDPFPFLEGLAGLIRERGLGVDDIQVEFVGSCTEYRGIPVASRVRDLNLERIVAIRSWVSHAEAQKLVETADLLLFLAQDQPAQVPNKLYDYLGTGIPILAFADEQGESALMLRQVGGHYLVTDDNPSTARKAVASAMDSRSITVGRSQEVLLEWTTEHQMAKLVAAVNLSSEGVVDGQSRSVAARSTI